MVLGDTYINHSTSKVTLSKNSMVDASGRLRVSQLSTIGEYKMLNNTFNSLVLEKVGTATFTDSNNKVGMSVTSGQYGIIQSKQYHPYLNGKSQLIEITTANFGTDLNVEKSIGYISSNAVAPYNSSLDGIRLHKSVNDVYSFQIWRNGTKIIEILRDNWIDKLDGTGPSGMTIDFNKFNVFGFDFLYLGGTSISLFVMYKGEFRLVYEYFYSNTDSEPFVLSPNKPIRYEIRSTTGSGNMDFICSLVASESMNYKTIGQSVVISGTNAGIVATTAGTTYAICGVRKAVNSRDIFSLVRTFTGALSTTNDYAKFALYLNPTISGTFSFGSLANTPFEYAVGTASNTLTGGFEIEASYGSQSTSTISEFENILARLNSTINNTMDMIVLGITPILGSANITATGLMHVDWLNQ